MRLEVKNISKAFIHRTGIFSSTSRNVLNNISFQIQEGQCLGLIGESGSGKSTLGRVIVGIEKPDSGEVLFERKIIQVDKLKQKMSIVFQDYTSSVNPYFSVIKIITEPLHEYHLSAKELSDLSVELLNKVGLNDNYLNRFPHELSGGELQRVCIARAISTNPLFILLDEPVSSLDVSVQVQVLDLLAKLKEELHLSYLFISHDLTAITYLCDRVIFFKDGQVVEDIHDIKNLCFVKTEYAKTLLGSVMGF